MKIPSFADFLSKPPKVPEPSDLETLQAIQERAKEGGTDQLRASLRALGYSEDHINSQLLLLEHPNE